MNSGSTHTGLVLVTHEGIGTALLQQASQILNDPLSELRLFEVGGNGKGTVVKAPKQHAFYSLPQLIMDSDEGAGVLILTDLPGATPCNLATRAVSENHRIVSGLNLPMLIRAWNYRHNSLNELVTRCIDGGKKAIMEPA